MIPVTDNNKTIEQKFEQLKLNLLDDFTISPINKYLENTPDKIYIPQEIIKNPFFLDIHSKQVMASRIGYKIESIKRDIKKKYRKEIKDQNPNIEIFQLEKLTDEKTKEEKAEIDNLIRRKIGVKDSISATELSNILKKEYNNGWVIKGSFDYGLPDEFDGIIWDIIQEKITEIFLKTNEFYTLYLISINEIMNELINRGVHKSRGGRQAERIEDSLNRLKETIYTNKMGFYRKDLNKYIPTQTYDSFSLVSHIYSKGETLPNKTIARTMGIAIDPLLVSNMTNNHYLITLNKKRKELKIYASKTMHDSLYYYAYIQIKKGIFQKSLNAKVKPHQVISYFKVCDILGKEPRTKSNYNKVKIKEHLEEIHTELKQSKIIEDVLIDENKEQKNKGENKFNLIYIFHETFEDTIYDFFNKSEKINYKEQLTINFTKEEISEYCAKIQKQIREPENIEKLVI